MKKLKANNITFYSSIQELKGSKNDIPFNIEKHKKYLKKMKKFHKKLNDKKD